MSNVTWFKFFSENGKLVVVAYAGSTPVIAYRTKRKEKLIEFLKRFPSAHNIHIATAQENEAMPRCQILDDDDPSDPRWIPWAKTPANDPKLNDMLRRLGHPNMQGKYRRGWPEGIIYHYTAGRPEPYGTIEYLWTRYPCLVVAPDGTLYQTFPLDEWAYHSGTGHHQFCVGVEVVCAGLLTPVYVNGATEYAPWYALDQATDVLKHPELCLCQAECRHVDGNNIETAGWYQKFTPEQEKTVEELCLYLKEQRPDVFSFDKIKGHNEAVAEAGYPHDKQDPGGSLSISMSKFRSQLKQKFQ